MGYYILGIIIFLLMVIFVSDLLSQRKKRDNENDDEYSDLYIDQYANQFYNTRYSNEIAEDIIEKQLAEEEGKAADMGVEPIYQNLEQEAFETRINEADKELEDVLPEDPDEDTQNR